MSNNPNPNEAYLKELKELYNQNFWPNNQEAEVTARITIQLGGRSIEFPVMRIWASSTVHDLFAGFAGFLQNGGALPPIPETTEAPPDSPPPAPAEPPLTDVGQVTYRGNDYLVEKTDEDTYRVLRKADRTQVNSASPTCKAIIKIFSQTGS